MSVENYIGDELSLFARAHNWKRYWSQQLEPLIEGPVLEVGAGIGSNLTLLRKRNQTWFALEPDPVQAEQIRTHHRASSKNVSVITGTLQEVEESQRFKTILYIDVLEHIEQDKQEVAKAFAMLEDGGRLIVLSPAHNKLFSPFDKAVGHYRRYNKKTLRALTPNSDSVKIGALFYLDSIGCMASLANALLLKSSMPTARQIWLWDSIMVPISRIFDRLTARRVGKTIVMEWRKSKD